MKLPDGYNQEVMEVDGERWPEVILQAGSRRDARFFNNEHLWKTANGNYASVYSDLIREKAQKSTYLQPCLSSWLLISAFDETYKQEMFHKGKKWNPADSF